MRRERAYVVDRRKLLSTLASVVDEGTIDQEVIDDTQHRQTGYAQGESDGPTPLDHIGLLDHALGLRVGDVVDRRHLGVAVDTRLGSPIVVVGTEEIDVVGREVEADSCQWARGVQERQLRRTHLDREHVESLGVHHRVDERDADVAHRRGAKPRRAQDRLEHQRRRGLAVGAGDDEPGRCVVALNAPGKLELAPYRNSLRLRCDDDGRRRRDPGRHHEYVDSGRQRLAVTEPHGGPDDLEDIGALTLTLPVSRVDDRHTGAEMDQLVGRGKPGDTDAHDAGVDARPVARASESGDVLAAHGRRIHSA